MEDIIKLESIPQYCELFGFESHHPLVEIVECSEPEKLQRYTINWGFYALYLKDTATCTITYGKTKYDHGDQTVLCFSPGQTTEVENSEYGIPKFVALLFHPDFILRTPLAQKIKKYSYFSYEANEALHLSKDERIMIYDCLMRIKAEIQHPIDKFSKDLIVSNIEILLDYCLRFYTRQFIMREDLNTDTLAQFEKLLDDYISSGKAADLGFPNVKYFADRVFLSPNYLGDMVKAETGKTAQEYIQMKIAAEAKVRLLDGISTISEVAYSLGFQQPQHFNRFFKREVGCTPKEFRAKN